MPEPQEGRARETETHPDEGKSFERGSSQHDGGVTSREVRMRASHDNMQNRVTVRSVDGRGREHLERVQGRSRTSREPSWVDATCEEIDDEDSQDEPRVRALLTGGERLRWS